jgi:dsRNA-specific ribonuclease
MLNEVIKKVLAKGKLSRNDIDRLVDKNIDIYRQAFTSAGYDPEFNYEDLEQKGDASANNFLVWYFYERFPQLNCPAGVAIIARLKIVYASKNSFQEIAGKLGFWSHINATPHERDTKRKSLLEDVFEAFIGATQQILDDEHELGFGFPIICRILKGIFDEIPISLEYEDLYDAKTRLKEFFDANPNVGKLDSKYDPQTRRVTLAITEKVNPVSVPLKNLAEFLANKRDGSSANISVDHRTGTASVTWSQTSGQVIRTLASAVASTKAEAEQQASLLALAALKVTTKKDLSLVCM